MLHPLRRLLYLSPLLLCAGCPATPSFPDTPVISNKSVEVFRKPPIAGTTKDSISITINWSDGDGDLGDTLRTARNYFLKVFKQKNGTFVEVAPVSTNGFNYRFPNLNPEGEKKLKLRGTLSYSFNGDGQIVIPAWAIGTIDGRTELVRPGDVIRFELYIVDRAGNRSNTITTDAITL